MNKFKSRVVIYCRLFSVFLCALILMSCAHSPPKKTSNICEILDGRRSWYKSAKRAAKQWDSSVPIIMAIMNQESRFKRKAKPPRTKILWIFPGPRRSDAYGFAQAKKATWRWYMQSSGNSTANRDNFRDAADFVAWYNYQSVKRNKVSKSDTYSLYLNYHEGHSGFAKGTYKKKAWLKKVARKVSNQAQTYKKQLSECEKKLKRKRFLFF